MTERNVLGGPLEPCGTDPLTGFYRDGDCACGPEDVGLHAICAVMTEEFLAHQARSATTCPRRGPSGTSPASPPATGGAWSPPAGCRRTTRRRRPRRPRRHQRPRPRGRPHRAAPGAVRRRPRGPRLPRLSPRLVEPSAGGRAVRRGRAVPVVEPTVVEPTPPVVEQRAKRAISRDHSSRWSVRAR